MSLARRAWGAERRNGVLVVLAMVAAAFATRAPAGVLVLGLVGGALLALQAAGVVLIYRVGGVINFAQAAFAGAGALIFINLVQYRSFLLLIDPLCPSGCAASPVGQAVNYWIAMLVSVLYVMLLGVVTYYGVIRRFANSPRLVLTVATIFVGYSATGLTAAIADALIPRELKERGPLPPPATPALPFDVTIRMGPAVLHAADLVTLAVTAAVLAAVVIYMERSAAGTVTRAVAGNPQRAAMLGINVNAVSARVWLISVGLAAATGILGALGRGVASGGADEARMLTAAVVGGLAAIPLAAAGALLLGALAQASQFVTGSTLPLDASLFLVLGVLLLLQPRARSRAADALPEWRQADEVRPIPAELRGLSAVRTARAALALIVAAVLAGLPWVLPPSTVSLATATVLYAMIGLSLLVLTGWAGQISLGQVAFAAIGAYFVALTPVPFPLNLAIAGAAGALAAVLVGIPALRLRGLHLAVMTLAFHVAVISVGLSPRYLGRFLPADLPRPQLLGLDLGDERAFYYVALVVTCLAFAAALGMRRSRTARALVAARDNERGAQAFGVDVTRARIGAFGVSGMLAAVAGALLAYHQGNLGAAAFSLDLSRTVFLYTVIGGLGSLAGPAVGFLYQSLPGAMSLPGLIPLLLTGPGGLILLLVAPGGLGQLLFAVRDAWLRRLARQHRVPVPSLLEEAAPGQPAAARLAPGAATAAGRGYVPSRYRRDEHWLRFRRAAAVSTPAEPAEAAR